MVGGIGDEMVENFLEDQGIQEKAKKRHSAQKILLKLGINEHNLHGFKCDRLSIHSTAYFNVVLKNYVSPLKEKVDISIQD